MASKSVLEKHSTPSLDQGVLTADRLLPSHRTILHSHYYAERRLIEPNAQKSANKILIALLLLNGMATSPPSDVAEVCDVSGSCHVMREPVSSDAFEPSGPTWSEKS
ncbi:hypothetical protein NPIL_549921 [Nephila pilipes]|uniref:Uncharacterized protein n=1 Tax=Nephila pilipes TaxID=299642 RepID=A0A8X6Q569_NEPPI|nr:hypothetical protein NPIL_549921 [Nephila pilipes]